MKSKIMAMLLVLALVANGNLPVNVTAASIDKRKNDAGVEVEENSLSLGGFHSAAITRNGNLYCWGHNSYGQVGNGTTGHQYTPVKVMEDVVSVSLSWDRSAAITRNGDLYCWGCNDYGQVGNGTTGHQYTPVKVMEDVVSVSLGKSHSAAITRNGDLYCWGYNSYGQIGDGTTNNHLYTPVKVMENVVSVSLGEFYSAAITRNGDLYCWGNNDTGQIGNGTVTVNNHQYPPVKVMEDVVSVSLGGYHSAAITRNGDLYCWGNNDTGQIGNGTTSGQYTPVKVMEDVASVSLGKSHSAAITRNGDLYCWGENDYGQVGNGTAANKLTPVKVLRDVKIDDIDTGDEEATIRVIRKSANIEYYNSYNVVKYEDTDSGKIIKAAINYNKAIEDYLSKLNKQASNDIKGNNKQKKSVGKQLMEKDKDVHTLTYVASDEYAIAAYEMLAEYYDECMKTGIDIGKIKITDDYITISSNIIKKIMNSIDCFERTSRINGHTVHADIFAFGGAISGSSCITVDGIRFIVSSSYNDVAKVMTDYINNLSDVTKDVLKQSLFSVLTELAHYTYIDQFAEDELKTLFNGKIDNLQKMGYGDLFKVLKGAKKTYNIAKKITAVKSTADLKQVLTTDSLKQIYKELSDTDFSDSTIKNETVNSAYNNVMQLKKALEDDLFNYIYGYKKEDEGVWQWIKRKININCPVDFIIYDSDNNIVASITDGVAKSNDSNIVLELNGDEKVIYILDERYINLQMTATDNGAMDVTIEDMSDGKPISRLNYYDINLTDEEKYAQELNADNINGQLNQFPIVSDKAGQINANDYFETTNDACVNIKCTSSEGGYVENDLSETYVKGDPVELYAISYDDFVFEGWYVNDKLVEISPLYRFTAKSDMSVHASFKKKEINYLTSLYDIEYGEYYDDFAWINIYDKNNSAYDVELKMYGIDETDNDISTLNIIYKKGDYTLSQKETIVLDENAEAYLDGILKKGYENITITDTKGNLVATLQSNGELPDIEILPTPTPTITPSPENTPKPIQEPSETPTEKSDSQLGEQMSTPFPDSTAVQTERPDSQPTALPTDSPTITIGTKATVGKMKYKVTKVDDNGAGKVTLIGTTRKKSDKNFTSLKIRNTVKIKGKSFKVTAIKDNAFRGYKKLKSVTVGKNIKKIGTKAFCNCKKLKKIVIKTKKLQAKKVGKKAFKGIYSKANIKVPKPKLKSYKKILRAKGVGKRAKIHT